MNNKYKSLGIILLIAVLLEVFLFNFRFWTTINYETVEYDISNFGEGLEPQTDGSYKFTGKENSYIELLNVDQEIKNIYIDFSCDNEEESGYRQLMTINITDEGNHLYYPLPQIVSVPSVEKSKYVRLYTSGKSEKLLISMDKDNNLNSQKDKEEFYLRFNGITVNKHVPFFFEPVRLLILIFILAVLYCLRYNTSIYEKKLCLMSKKQILFAAFVVFLNILAAVFIYKNNLLYYSWDRQVYVNLAKALLQGHFDLPMLNVDDRLLNMGNQYDTAFRNSFVNAGGHYYWDYAFYMGKYYVYFGIVPCLILFLPLLALFNIELPINMAMLIFTTAYIITGFKFIYTIAKKYWNEIPFIMYIMLSEMFVFGSALTTVFIRNDLYGIPNITALTFTLLGLDLWLNSLNDDGDIKSIIRLFLGSLCMSLAVGCRPQFALGSFFALFIFKNTLWRKKYLLSFEKRDILSIAAFIIPYIVIGSFLMYYNYARFGSVTDFGALYNLTTNDMTKRGFRLARVPYGLFAYLFQIPTIVCSFPFLDECRSLTRYMGVSIVENMRGGIFIFNPLLFLNFFAYTKPIKKYLKENKLFSFVVTAQIFALIIIMADINMAGLVFRYLMDFTWLFMLAAFAVLMCIFINLKNEYIKPAAFAFSAIFIISMVINILLVFTPYHHYGMDSSNPNVFYSIMYAFEFWL